MPMLGTQIVPRLRVAFCLLAEFGVELEVSEEGKAGSRGKFFRLFSSHSSQAVVQCPQEGKRSHEALHA